MSTAVATSLADRLRAFVGPANVLASPSDLLVYECDGFTIEKNKPEVVVFPSSPEQIVGIVNVNRVLGIELVLPDGRVVRTGGPTEDNPGYDLTGVIVGSEGTFGVAAKIWVRITRNPEAYRTLLGVFETVDDATNTISDIIGAGIIPGALEMLDPLIMQAVEAAFHFGFPLEAGAVLIMEVDWLVAGLGQEAQPRTP